MRYCALPFVKNRHSRYNSGQRMVRYKQYAVAVMLCWGWMCISLGVAQADVYSYVDKEGVTHFTNRSPNSKNKQKWTKVFASEPSPNSKPSGQTKTCKRCDSVGARDKSPQRFHRYDNIIDEASRMYSIPKLLIRAVIKVESDFDPRVVSSVGARGLMQLMPAVVHDMGIVDPHHPRQNILAGTRLLRVLANRFDGDLVLTIAGYHAGAGAVMKYDRNVPPYKNTRKYLRMVLKRYYYLQKQSQNNRLQ